MLALSSSSIQMMKQVAAGRKSELDALSGSPTPRTYVQYIRSINERR